MKKILLLSILFVSSIFSAENMPIRKENLLSDLYEHEMYQEFLRIFNEDFEIYNLIKDFDYNKHLFNLTDKHRRMIQIFQCAHHNITQILGQYQRDSLHTITRSPYTILVYTNAQLLDQMNELTHTSNNSQLLLLQSLQAFKCYVNKARLRERAKSNIDILTREIRFLQYEPSSGMPLEPLCFESHADLYAPRK
ncbi:hypothetical protein A3F66_06755 [candidate division TM6 bacterium RIFCSPHIGHO2_12_FULL_32_22]|nr:MAG: hypothetical protein A3F66_06755 [candidate division TM6 bacterium RIFCSPHIGHO2_12_FULL_32_22]